MLVAYKRGEVRIGIFSHTIIISNHTFWMFHTWGYFAFYIYTRKILNVRAVKYCYLLTRNSWVLYTIHNG